MPVILIPICFFLTFLGLGVSRIVTSKNELLICTVLMVCVYILIGTEALSALHRLSFIPLLIYWLLVTAALTAYLYSRRKRLKYFTGSLRKQSMAWFNGFGLFEKTLPMVLAVLLIIVFVQGVAYPPTNWDSMTYHLARITSWIGHRSVAYYPTDITRQIYQPPFAEYIITHINLLAGCDYFSASVQFFSLIFSLVVINAITGYIGLDKKARLFSMIIGATIPEGILQASSTQNDVVEGLFILASFYFTLKAIASGQLKYFLFLGLAAGFGLLVKGTGYIYLFPVLSVLGIITLINLFRKQDYRLPTNALMALLLIAVINSGYYLRNCTLAHNLFGIDKTEAKVYSNAKMSPALLASAVSKNAALHMELMFAKKVSFWADSGITKLHRAAAVNINDPAVNYRGMRFGLNTDVTSEDNAPNPIHLILIILSMVIAAVFYKRLWKDRFALVLLVVVLLQVLFFCAYLRWQPWNSRLHTPVFLLSTPFIAYALSLSKNLFKLNYLIAPVLLIYALLAAIHNDDRPLSKKMLTGRRYQKYFAGKPNIYKEYDQIDSLINRADMKSIGLIFGVDDWEYPLFANCYDKTIIPVYIMADNITRSLDTTVKPVDCIVSTRIDIPFIDYNKRRYYNQEKGNKIIYLYK